MFQLTIIAIAEVIYSLKLYHHIRCCCSCQQKTWLVFFIWWHSYICCIQLASCWFLFPLVHKVGCRPDRKFANFLFRIRLFPYSAYYIEWNDLHSTHYGSTFAENKERVLASPYKKTRSTRRKWPQLVPKDTRRLRKTEKLSSIFKDYKSIYSRETTPYCQITWRSASSRIPFRLLCCLASIGILHTQIRPQWHTDE